MSADTSVRFRPTVGVIATVAGSLLALLPLAFVSATTASAAPGHGDVIRSGSRDSAPAFKQGKYPRGQVKLGTVRTWPAYDYAYQRDYPKQYTLRAIGRHVEIWVASGSDGVSTGLDYPPGDCRTGVQTTVTDDQLAQLVKEYDKNMHPKVSEVFGKPPALDGSDALLPKLIPIPKDSFAGEGDNVVVLVDNIRGEGFYDPSVETGANSAPLGFYDGWFVTLTGRNIVTLSGVSWLHRFGASPVDASEPGARPCGDHPADSHSVESILAHEYTHSVQRWNDPDESSWVDEGEANWVETLTGYKDPRVRWPGERASFFHTCFQGFLALLDPRSRVYCDAGPANSLTLWRDQVEEISGNSLADYGAAGSFIHMLAGRYGNAFIGALDRHPGNGLSSLKALLEERGSATDAPGLISDWAALNALDGVLDDGATLTGGDPAAFSEQTLRQSVRWEGDGAYAAPGVKPNASDYVRLRAPGGRFLAAEEVDSITFEGASGVSAPVEWTVDPDGRASGDPALYSGSGPDFDRSLAREVTVPADDPTLRFATRYEIETGWDFGFVQVSTDGGKTYQSLPAQTTTSDAEPDSLFRDDLPGFTGDSDGWIAESVDLSSYAGQKVLVAFRYRTDPLVEPPGWWIDDISLGGAPLGAEGSLDGWQTQSQINPRPLDNWVLQLVGYTDDNRAAWHATVPLDAGFDGTLSGEALREAIGTQAQTVAALITHLDPDESERPPARYRLTVNGVEQPGG